MNPHKESSKLGTGWKRALSTGLAISLSAALPAAAISPALAAPATNGESPSAEAQTGIEPVLGNATRLPGGYNVDILNYDELRFSYIVFTPYSLDENNQETGITASIIADGAGGGYVAVRGLEDGGFADIQLRAFDNASSQQSDVVAFGSAALNAPWDPEFDLTTLTSTEDGFVVGVTNLPFDSSYPYEVVVTGDAPDQSVYDGVTATIDWATEQLIVTGMTLGLEATITVATSNPGVAKAGFGSVTGSALTEPETKPALTLEFLTETRLVDGFDVRVTNYDPSFNINLLIDSTEFPGVSIEQDSNDPSVYQVRGLGFNESARIDYFTFKDGHEVGAGFFEGSSAALPSPQVTINDATAGEINFSISNFDAQATYALDEVRDAAGELVASASLNSQGAGQFTIAGLDALGEFTFTITSTLGVQKTSTAGTATVAEGAALTPSLETSPTSDGFTVQVTNYDPAWAWVATVDSVNGGDVPAGVTVTADDGNGLFVVTGVGVDQRVEVTVTSTQPLHQSGSASLSAYSAAALALAFGPATPVDGGFTSQATIAPANIDGVAYSVALVDSEGNSIPGATAVFDDQTDTLTVGGLPNGASAVAQVTATAGSSSITVDVSGVSLFAAQDIIVSDITRTDDGFQGIVANIDDLRAAGFDVAFDSTRSTSSQGSAINPMLSADGSFIVSGLQYGENATVVLVAQQAGYKSGEIEVSEAALQAPVNIEFGEITSGKGFFQAELINLPADAAQFDSFTNQWTVVDSNGQPVGNVFAWYNMSEGFIRVEDLPAGELVTVSGEFFRPGHASTPFTVQGAAFADTPAPELSDVKDLTTSGFTLDILNFEPGVRYSAIITPWGATTQTNATASVDSNGTVVVSGATPGDTLRVTVAIFPDGANFAQTIIDVDVPRVGVTPDVRDVNVQGESIWFNIYNYDTSYTWNITWAAASGESGTVTEILDLGQSVAEVTARNLPANTEIVFTVATQKAGHESLQTTFSKTTRKGAAEELLLGPVTATADGYTVQVLNTNDTDWEYAAFFFGNTDLPETATVTFDEETKIATVTGLPYSTSAKILISAITDPNLETSFAPVEAISLAAPALATFAEVDRGEGFFSVSMENYQTLVDEGFAVDVQVSSGTVEVSDSGVVTVSGLSDGQMATVTVATSQDGYVDGSATVDGVALDAPALATFAEVDRGEGFFSVSIENYQTLVDEGFVVDVQVSSGTVEVSDSGVVTVSGLTDGQMATVTVATSQDGYVDGSATVDGAALDVGLAFNLFRVVPQAGGFTATIQGYDPAYTFTVVDVETSVNAPAAQATIEGDLITVTGLPASAVAVVTVESTRDGFLPTQASASGRSSQVELLNYVSYEQRANGFVMTFPGLPEGSKYTFEIDATGPRVDAEGEFVTVSGMNPGEAVQLTVTLVDASGDVVRTNVFAGESLEPSEGIVAPVPQLGNVTARNFAFSVNILNFDENFDYQVTADVANADITREGNLITVSGLASGQAVEVSVTVTRDGFVSSSQTVSGASRAFPSADPEIRPEIGGFYIGGSDGFTVVVNAGPGAGFTTELLPSGEYFIGGLAPGQPASVPVFISFDNGEIFTRVIEASAGMETVKDVSLSQTFASANIVEYRIVDPSSAFTYSATATLDGVALPESSVQVVGDRVQISPIGKGGAVLEVTVSASREDVVLGSETRSYVTPEGFEADLSVGSVDSDGNVLVEVSNFDSYFTYDFQAFVNGTSVAVSAEEGMVTISGLQSGDVVRFLVGTSGDGYTGGFDEVTFTA